MIDRLFSLALLFCVLAGGTTAIGLELFRQPAPVVAELPRVVVTGRVTTAAATGATTRVATAAPADAPVQAR